MKYTSVLLILISSFNIRGEISVLPPGLRYGKKEIIKENRKVHRKRNDNSILNEIKKSNKRIDDLLSRHLNTRDIIDNTQSYLFPTGTVIRGMLLNSVVSTNLESPLLVAVTDSSKVPAGTKFSCSGVTKHNRVITACNLMITDHGEFEVSTILLNTDGSAGLRGEVYDSREAYMAASVATGLAKGVIVGAQDRIATNLGEVTPNSIKNMTLQGILEAGNEASEILKNEARDKENIVSVNAGTKVLIYFKRRFQQ